MQASIYTARKQRTEGWLTEQSLVFATQVLLLVALCIPVLTAQRSPLNSDQSLYLAEALNIANGDGLVYASGDPIVHRAPLYPALLAGVFAIDGASLEAAYLLPRFATVLNVLLLFLLGRALFGPWGGIVAAVSAAASLYLRGLGTTLFLDSAQVTFLLAALYVYWRADQRRSAPLMAAAGALLGASVLIKEASVLFLPLPLLIALFRGFDPGWKQRLPAWFAGFALAAGWWWVWVLAHTGELFLVGSPAAGFGLLLLACGGATLVAAVALLKLAPAQFAAGRATRLVAAGLLLGWNALFFAGLESTGWQYESNYLASVPSYLTQVFLPNVQPAPLIFAAWAWLAVMALRSPQALILLTCGLLYAAFFVLVADRGLSLRDQLPLVYLSYLALGGAAAWLVNAGAGVKLGAHGRGLGGAGALTVTATLAAIVVLSGTSLSQPRAAGLQDDWQNPLSAQAAAWLSANLEPGAVIMSSRLYYSHLYFLTDGAYPVHQLPTVEVELHLADSTAAPLTRRSTLFRWENHVMPADSADDRWLYLTRYPLKGYFIGLAENDLLQELERRHVDYVVISATDAGFSSPSLNQYFAGNPAFELLQVITAGNLDEVRIYRLQRDALAPRELPAQVTQSARDYVFAAFGSPDLAGAYLERLNPAGFTVNAH